MKTTILILLSTFLFAGQTEISLRPDQSSMQIFGTSSLHDWESDVKDFSINGILVDDNIIRNLKVKVEAESIKSGKSIMDSKTYDALESGDHPLITFSADELTIDDQKVQGQGNLSMAGETKTLPVDAKVVERKPGSIKIEGEVILKMTEYGIDPPTAMFGSISTGDQVTVKYSILLSN